MATSIYSTSVDGIFTNRATSCRSTVGNVHDGTNVSQSVSLVVALCSFRGRRNKTGPTADGAVSSRNCHYFRFPVPLKKYSPTPATLAGASWKTWRCLG